MRTRRRKQMEANMSVEEVVNKISKLVEKEGKTPRKKEVKKSDPELMKNALYYFPSWDTAVEHSIGS
jgi:predicted ArsR family transcriptional regulator